MSAQAETIVIGKIFRHNELFAQCNLRPEEFQVESMRRIYEAIEELASDGKPFDIILAGEVCEKNYNWNALPVISQCFDAQVSASNFDDYVQIVKQDHINLQARSIANELIKAVDSKAKGDFVADAIGNLMQLGMADKRHSAPMKECLEAAVEKIKSISEMQGLVGISTGLSELDEKLGGFHKSDLIVIGARPAMGKTAFMISAAEKCDARAGIISAEQGREQIGMRFISVNGTVSSNAMRTANLSDQDITRLDVSVRTMINRPIWINDEPAITLDSLIKQAREWKFKNDIEIIYVDYLQKIAVPGAFNKTEQVTKVVGALKNLARELNIPVVALAQVKRDVENRPDSRPKMGDMSDASEIEKEADQIMTLYRDVVYNSDINDHEKNIAEIDVVKNRHGPTGFCRVLYEGEYFQFKDIKVRAA